MKPRERIGIFGGTFNPIHSGHIRAAVSVQRRFSLDRVLFIPSFIPPHKNTLDVAPAEDRLAMVRIALGRRRRLLTSALEIEAGGTSYSIRTLGWVRKAYPRARVFFIMGVDAFLEIETWREWRRLIDRCSFIVTSRPSYSLRRARRVLDESYQSRILVIPKFARIREASLDSGRIFLVPIDALDVSSTKIRRLVRQGRSLRGLVPRRVELYIKKRRLYVQPGRTR
jgi:nicotinate-nucleotide adenylyltransferase